ncbi:hypothetical protein FG379_001402 [Cryptosporidium bovis]|uniref:uncharacterized protein n=1 Tax=Cryptosporidium bovis TaxID=310047 RepID=UPI00351A0006|nr:hypothetical protein FG379_001402 [Cryptosporidium bovis]
MTNESKDDNTEDLRRKKSTNTVVIEENFKMSDVSEVKKRENNDENASLIDKYSESKSIGGDGGRTSEVVYKIKINGVYPDFSFVKDVSDKNNFIDTGDSVNDNPTYETDNRSDKTKLIDEIKKEALSSFLNIKFDLMEQYLEIRNQLLKGQKGIRVISMIATINILLIGIINILIGMVSFNFVKLFTSMYITLISMIILLQEISRKRKISRIQILLRTWFKFIELSTGRGVVQVLLSTLTCGLTNSIYISLISLFIGFAGLLNISFGVMAARKMVKIINLLRFYGSQDMENLKILDNNSVDVRIDINTQSLNKENDPEYKLKMIHRLFDLLDEDGNGYVDKDEFSRGFSSLRLPFELSENEMDIIFENLDCDQNGQVSVEEFESWFISNKCPYFIL